MAKKESKEKTPARTLKVVGGQGKKDNGDGDAVDFASVRALARIATEFDLEEIEVNGAGHLRVRRAVAREAGSGGASAGAATASSRPIALTPPVEAKGEAGTFVTSPFVGTFYRAPSPEAPSFVEVGTSVRKGQVVCIVEAMKLMNEIEAESEGRVEEILVKNGEHVEYGQHLIRVSKS
ncbi:MAG TPA: acetyl-CoA carboxylase biotin carboxyl carrier protein [Polyangia bacterium]|jgi:acetyl-CoA carboxylase biotin carboxyl carrier protein|nr:acetyl-CoA carboxylase biotin carboxyl carrier protein [Polyangia bacterium]